MNLNMYVCDMMSDIYLHKQIVCFSQRELSFYLFILLFTIQSSTDAVTLTGSSEYAVPGGEFTLTCDVPEEANIVQLYRRRDLNTILGIIQVAVGQCYNVATTTPVICSPDVCSCTTTSNLYGTVFHWVIQPQTGDHGSVWFCTRTNVRLPDADRIVNSPDYTLNVADGPGTVTLSPHDTTYSRTEGDTLPDITCISDCRPGCTFVWTKPDNTNFTTSAVLSLGQLDRSEHGTYRCMAGNVVGELTTTVFVSVMYGAGTVTLSPPDTNYTRTDGDTLPDITCAADCRPGCTFVWTKPDNTNFTASAVLSLGQLVKSEHGTYICTAGNVAGESTTTTSVIVTVQYGPSTVTLSPPDTTYTRTEGNTLPDITCTADCRPGCNFVWTKPDNTNFTASSVLSLGKIDRSEHGTYICIASNVVKEVTATTSLTVQYGPGESITFQPQPDVLDSIENQTIPEIVCSADCSPSCAYIWSKAGRGYPNPLSLPVAVRGNAGRYVCTANNVVSQGSKTWNLIVRFPPRIVSLSYTQGDADVTENGSKSVICSVESYPPSTIQWYYKANNTVLLTTPDVLKSTYTLATAGCLDTGVYTCSARNSVANIDASKDIYINVLCKPRPYEVPGDDHIVDISLSETLTIPAVFISNPEPLFTWKFQLNQLTAAKELFNGTDNFAIQNNFETANLSAVSVGIRTNIQDEWFGVYTVTATNSQGSEMVSFTVIAQRNPSPTKILSVDCGKQRSAEVSWKDGGNSQFYRVLFSMDAFEHSKEVYPLAIAFEDGRNIYNLYVDNLVGGRLYTFKIAAYNNYGNTTSLDAVGCTVQGECSRGTDNMYVTGVALICTGVLTLLLTVGLGLFISRNGRLPFIKGQHLKQMEFQNMQLSERAVTHNEEEDERSPYEQLDTNEITKASVYSEIGSHLSGRRKDPVSDNREYESLEGRSNPNVYEELHGTTSGEKEIYINTAIAEGGSGSRN